MTYYYKHTNGEVIAKPDIVVDMGGGPHMYFNSPFVENWWYNQLAPDELLMQEKEINEE